MKQVTYLISQNHRDPVERKGYAFPLSTSHGTVTIMVYRASNRKWAVDHARTGLSITRCGAYRTRAEALEAVFSLHNDLRERIGKAASYCKGREETIPVLNPEYEV